MLSYQFIVLSLFSVSVSSIVSAKPLAACRNSSSNLKGAGPSIIDVNGFVHDSDPPAPFWRIQQTGQYGYMFKFADLANDNITLNRHGDNPVTIASVSDTGTDPSQQFQIERQIYNSNAPAGKRTGLCVQGDNAPFNLSTVSCGTGHAQTFKPSASAGRHPQTLSSRRRGYWFMINQNVL
uniref:Ricin B lectin domain-containing protein n=1 Tax=Moniliophthora roreri TaxID=221103 RepID=A0A0W0FTK1_MONRR